MEGLASGQVALLRNIAINNGFSELDIRTKAGSQKGDNYMGVITSVTLKNYAKDMNLVLKTSHSNEKYRNAANIKAAFEREVFVYETVLPELNDFQKQYDMPYPFRGYPNYFGSHVENNMECLVMADIRSLGYGMWDRKKAMDKSHIIAVVKEYAKLHSVSLALSEKKPEVFNDIKKRMYDIYAETYNTDGETVKAFAGKMMEKALKISEGYKSAEKAIENFIPKILDYYKNDLLNPEYLRVFIHGDCWCNNLMFIYEDKIDTTKPTRTSVLDWQMSKCSSPGLDLVYFLFCSATRDILDNYKEILMRYYEVLSDNLKSAGCNPEVVFPFPLLQTHFRQYAKFGLIMAVLNIQVILCDPSEAPDLNSTTDGDLLSILNINPLNVEAANQRILDLILFMDENDLF